jgi:hypothetical protein
VTLYVDDGVVSPESATIRLPVFSFDPPAYLAFSPLEKPEKVEIGGETEIDVGLRNSLKQWPVRIEGISQPSLKGLWRQADFLPKGQKKFIPFDVPAGLSRDKLVLKLVPNSGSALLRNLFSHNSQGDPEIVAASLEYRAKVGLQDLETQVLPVEIPVRFVPWPPLLPVALTIGTFLGSLIPLATRQRRHTGWLHAFGSSWLMALLAWAIAIFLIQHESEFRLLGFTLDPFQLLPTALIGALLGMLGFKSVEVVKRLVPGLEKETGAKGANQGKKS